VRKTKALSRGTSIFAVAVLPVAGPASATLVAVGDPFDSGSWTQPFHLANGRNRFPSPNSLKILLDNQGHVCYHDDIRVKKFLRGHRFKFENEGLRKRGDSLARAFYFSQAASQDGNGMQQSTAGERREDQGFNDFETQIERK